MAAPSTRTRRPRATTATENRDRGPLAPPAVRASGQAEQPSAPQIDGPANEPGSPLIDPQPSALEALKLLKPEDFTLNSPKPWGVC